MKIHALRLNPGDDLKKNILSWAASQRIKAGCILTCIGSLKSSNLRFANRKEGNFKADFQEIISLSGTFSQASGHFHISLSDEKGQVIAGHLLEENIIYTTAEIVILELTDYEFNRELDGKTGFKELLIRKL